MTEKLLRGKEPLTFWRGANGAAGGYLYRGGLLDETQVDPQDAERLIQEGFLERVVRDGETFRLAEDTDTGSKGDPVSLGDSGFPPESELDNGTLNADQQKAAAEATAEVDSEVEQKRAAARQKLTDIGGEPDGRSSEAVLVEYLVLNGYDRAEVEKANRTELKNLVSSVKK